jgi:hypothetical protein
VSDQTILDHLQGRHVMGVYPLLADETCWFLTADFDKSTWKADIAAFRQTCDAIGVPAATERSRSGTSPRRYGVAGRPGRTSGRSSTSDGTWTIARAA